jgi:hypothetical protein
MARPETVNKPIPMRTETSFQAKLEITESPTDIAKHKKLKKQMGFSYCQAIRELIFALCTCQPDISVAVIKLSQYSANPAKCHYKAVKHVFAYLQATATHVIYYWCPLANPTLPDALLPLTILQQDALKIFHESMHSLLLHGNCDSTWASDRQHC